MNIMIAGFGREEISSGLIPKTSLFVKKWASQRRRGIHFQSTRKYSARRNTQYLGAFTSLQFITPVSRNTWGLRHFLCLGMARGNKGVCNYINLAIPSSIDDDALRLEPRGGVDNNALVWVHRLHLRHENRRSKRCSLARITRRAQSCASCPFSQIYTYHALWQLSPEQLLIQYCVWVVDVYTMCVWVQILGSTVARFRR